MGFITTQTRSRGCETSFCFRNGRQDFAIIDTGDLNYITCVERSGKQVEILVLRASAKAWYAFDAEKYRDSEYAIRFVSSSRVAEKTRKM